MLQFQTLHLITYNHINLEANEKTGCIPKCKIFIVLIKMFLLNAIVVATFVKIWILVQQRVMHIRVKLPVKKVINSVS